jgi:predicted small lipoprotein YifL
MRALLPVIVAGLLLAGCGYKGPLYLPKPKPVAQQPAPKPAQPQDDMKPESDPEQPNPERGTKPQ